MHKNEFPEGPDTIKATLILCSIFVAISIALMCFFFSGCTPSSLTFFEKEIELLKDNS